MAQLIREAAEQALRGARLAKDPLDDLIGIIREAPPDLAEHHDRYLQEASTRRRRE
jgi:hypothetical protein